MIPTTIHHILQKQMQLEDKAMNLLREIQSLIVQDGSELNLILLKLRLLAARLGSSPLEEWIKHESEGYPNNVDIPDYRVIGIVYTGSFSGSFGKQISNSQIPPFLIEKYAGENHMTYKVRQSIAEIDDLVKNIKGDMEIDTSNLILLLQGKIYPDLVCNQVRGRLPRVAFVGIQSIVRHRILEFTTKLEKSVPAAMDIVLESPTFSDKVDPDQVTSVYNQTVYGNVTSISNSGDGSHINVSIGKGNSQALIESLVKVGIPKSDAATLAGIMASESPSSGEEPLGTKTAQWLDDNLPKAVKGAWKISATALTEIVKAMALQYYGLR